MHVQGSACYPCDIQLMLTIDLKLLLASAITHGSWYTYTHMHARLILTIDPFRLSPCRTVTTNQNWQQG